MASSTTFTATALTPDPLTSVAFIDLSESLAVDSSYTGSFIQTDENVLQQYYAPSAAASLTDFAIYVEVPKWMFFNGGMKWNWKSYQVLDASTNSYVTRVFDSHDGTAGAPLLTTDIVQGANYNYWIKNFDKGARFTQLKQCNKFFKYSFKVGDPVNIPLIDANGVAIADPSGVQYTRSAQLNAVYLDPSTGEPLPYAQAPNLNTHVYYYVDNQTINNALSTISLSGTALTAIVDGSALPVTSLVPPHPDMPNRVPDSSGAGENALAYWAGLGAATTIELPPVGMRNDVTNVNVGNLMVDGYYNATTSSNNAGSNAWKAFSKQASSQWMSASATVNNYAAPTATPYEGTNSTPWSDPYTGASGTVSGEWLQLQMPTGILLGSYRLSPITLNNGPRQFTLLASPDGGETWDLLDSRTNVNLSTGAELVYTLPKPVQKRYSIFRLVMELGFGSRRCGVESLKFYDVFSTMVPSAGLTANTSTISGQVYIASASSTADANATAAFKAFDLVQGTYFQTSPAYTWNGAAYTGTSSTSATLDISSNVTVSGEWIQLFLPSPADITSYTISSSGVLNAPMDWRLYGSYNQSEFYLLDTQTGVTDWINNTKTFTVSTISGLVARRLRPDVPFNYYRLVVTRITNGQQVAIAEIRLNAKAKMFPNVRLPPQPITASSQLMNTANIWTDGSYNCLHSRGSAQVGNAFNMRGNTSVWTVAAYYNHSRFSRDQTLRGWTTIDASTLVSVSGSWWQLTCSGASASGFQVAKYTIVPTYAGAGMYQNPAAWTLFGSNDGGLTWFSVHSASSYGAPMNASGSTFTVPQPAGGYPYYKSYKLVVSDMFNAPFASISTLEFQDPSNNVFPPAPMTSSSGVTVSGVTYIPNSDSVDASLNCFKIFDGSAGTNHNNVSWNYLRDVGFYATPSGVAKTTTIDVSNNVHEGEWLQIQLPRGIQLTGYMITPTNLESVRWSQPTDWVVLGSNDASSWRICDSRTSYSLEHNANNVALNDSSVPFVNNGYAVPALLTVSQNQASTFSYFRFVFKRKRDNYQNNLTVGDIQLFGQVTSMSLPSNRLVWSPPATYSAANPAYGAQLKHITSDPSRALLLYWDVSPVSNKPSLGNELFGAWSSVSLGLSGLAPLRDLDLSASDYLTKAASSLNKMRVMKDMTGNAASPLLVHLGLQNPALANAAARLLMPVSSYKANINGQVTKLVPFSYDSANLLATGNSSLTHVGGRLLQLFAHYVFNGVSDSELGYLSQRSSDASRLNDVAASAAISMLSSNTSRSLLIQQIMSRMGRNFFDEYGALSKNTLSSISNGEMREVLRNLEDMFLVYNVQVGQRVIRKSSGRSDLIQITDVPVVMRLKNHYFSSTANVVPFVDLDATYTVTDASGNLTSWPNLAVRSAYASRGGVTGLNVATPSGFSASGNIPPTVTTITTASGDQLPSVLFASGSYNSIRLANVTLSNVTQTGFTAVFAVNRINYDPSATSYYVDGLLQMPNVMNIIRSVGGGWIVYPGGGGAGQQGFSLNTSGRSVIVVTMAPSGSVSNGSVYMNGSLLLTYNNYASTFASTISTSVDIGARLGGFNSYSGSLLQVQFYQQVLTPSQIAELTAALRYKWRC